MTVPYTEIKSTSAAAFIDDLRQTLFEDCEPEIASRFIFRGQGNSEWKLVPSAFRGATILGYENRKYTRVAAESPKYTWDQGNAEFVALMEFLNLADRVGLDIPTDHKWLRPSNQFNNVVGQIIGTLEWPPTELYEALALAQHHGVPTRLMDFSYDPLIAAYFGAENPDPSAQEIAVWSIDLQLIAMVTHNWPSGQIEIVTVPRVRNKNLVA
jgi:FRG domain